MSLYINNKLVSQGGMPNYPEGDPVFVGDKEVKKIICNGKKVWAKSGWITIQQGFGPLVDFYQTLAGLHSYSQYFNIPEDIDSGRIYKLRFSGGYFERIDRPANLAINMNQIKSYSDQSLPFSSGMIYSEKLGMNLSSLTLTGEVDQAIGAIKLTADYGIVANWSGGGTEAKSFFVITELKAYITF